MGRLQSAEQVLIEEKYDNIYEMSCHVAPESNIKQFVKPDQDESALHASTWVPEVKCQNAWGWPHLGIDYR